MYFIPPTSIPTHNARYWKIKRTSLPDILLLTHYIMHSHCFFAFMHGCSHAPPESPGLHAYATCSVCCGDGAPWRWMRSAVWNSADPLKWLLAATRERGDLRGEHADRCLTPTLNKTHTSSMFSSGYREARTRSLSFNRLQVYYSAHLDKRNSFSTFSWSRSCVGHYKRRK